MSTNRGVYDHRQFLHYPDKDPFSNAAQKRLDDLVKDFLHTGIAFANGASIRDLTVEHPGERAYLPNPDLDNVTNEEDALVGAVENVEEDEDEDFEGEFKKLDKGKARDEREGPGLQGLWSRTHHLEPGTSPAGASVDDAISLLDGSESGNSASNDEGKADADGFYEEAYEDGEVYDEGEPNEGGSETADFGPNHSRAPSSEQEIIYIGDSDEDEPREALSDVEPHDDIEHEPEWLHHDVREEDNEKSADWGSEFDEEEERQGLERAWGYVKDGEKGDSQEPEWHRSQGKESDDDERGLIAGDGDHEGSDVDDRHPQMSQVDSMSTARRFFTSASRVDPWTSLPAESNTSGSPTLDTVAWDPQSLWRDREEQMGGRKHPGTVENLHLSSFMQGESMHDHQDQDDTEVNELGPPPELQPEEHMEDLVHSFSPPDTTDILGISYPHLLIPEPDILLPEQSPKYLASSSNTNPLKEGQAIELTHVTPAAELSGAQVMSDSNQAFLSSMITSPDMALDAGVLVPESHDVFDMAPVGFHSAEHQAHGGSPGVPESIPSAFTDATQPHSEPTVEESALEEESIEVTAPDSELADFSLHGETLTQEPNDSKYVDYPENVHQQTQGFQERRSSSPLVNPNVSVATKLLPGPSQEPGTTINVLESPMHGTPSSEEESNEDIQFQPLLLHPAVFDDVEEMRALTDTETRSPTPLPAITSVHEGADIEDHDMGNGSGGDQTVAIEVVSDFEEDTQDAQGFTESLEHQELGGHNLNDVIVSEYVVSEVTSEDGRIRTRTASPQPVIILGDGAQNDSTGRSLPTQLVPAISVGSSTPPLSPTATVTNSSSAPDPSVATSDLSTVNLASVSVVTSTGSPPPIHVSRISPTPADVRRLSVTYVGRPPDQGQDSDEDVVLPDPRLPPEPTHLRIPVGVIGRSVGEDKEELAESMKVEPPTPHVRSESEDDSLNSDIRGVRDAERTPPALTVEKPSEMNHKDDEKPSGLEELVAEDTHATVSPMDRKATDIKGADLGRNEEAIGELAYPDSGSEYLSKDDGIGRESIPLSDPHCGSPEADGTPQSSLPILEAFEPSSIAPSTIPEEASSMEVLDAAVSPKRLSDDNVLPGVNGHHMGLNGQTEDMLHKQSDEAKHLSHLAPGGLTSSSVAVDDKPDPSTPTVSEGESPTKSEGRLRTSTKGKARMKTSERRSESPPPPQSVIYARSRRTPGSRKHSRPDEPSAESFKQRRLTRSATARTQSNLSNGDATSTSGVFDDKSDVSSVASSSSAVSRFLIPRGSGSSSLSTSSRSPSIVSQASPTSVEHSSFVMPPPIRPYVPHNHSHHTPTPTPPFLKNASTERTTPVHRKPSVSPSPTSLSPQSTSTHLTRASCTDHKISFPGSDGLLYFLVPRCSLLDPEVEKDVNIVDCGVATKEEVKRAVGDLEAVGLNSTILGVIRQLAGVQLMREGQVGYLPKPGERFRDRVKHRRSHIPPPSLTQDVAPQVDPSGPSGAGSSHTAALSLDSVPSPVSTSGSSLSDVTKPEGGTFKIHNTKTSTGDHGVFEATSEDEDGSEPDDHDNVTIMPLPHSPESIRSSATRKRKLRRDDLTYKPEIDGTESSSDTETVGGRKKSKRSLKRRRSKAPDEVMSGDLRPSSPKKKRKRQDTELSTNPDGSLDGASETHRKKPRRKKAANRHPVTEDNATTPI